MRKFSKIATPHLPLRGEARWGFFVILFLCLASSLRAQEEGAPGLRALPDIMSNNNVDMVSIGHASQLDTYLSPEHYSGLELRYIGERSRWHKSPQTYHTFTTQGYITSTSPRSDNASNLSGMFEISFGLHKQHTINDNLYLSYGIQADAFIGGTYNTHNGNNPAQLHTGTDIAPTAKASYLFTLFKRQMLLNYSVSVPLVGLQFSPAYGQPYYEIFSEGNYDHNICFTSPFNAASLSNRITLDIPVKHGGKSRSAIRVGYLGDFRQAKLNDIKSHHFTHGFIIGYAY